jgi:asparagine synthetase B (glutamine-hydrolysing)
MTCKNGDQSFIEPVLTNYIPMMISSQTEWEQFILMLKKENILSNNSFEELSSRLADILEKTIINQAKKALEKGPIGLLYSGGVDSTIIAFVLKKHKIPFHCVTVGFFDDEQKLPEDIEVSRISAKKLNLPWKEQLYTFSQAQNLLEETILCMKNELANSVNVGVGSVTIAGVQTLKKINPDMYYVFTGLGSEEIFAGYQRHKIAQDPHEECWNGLVHMYERDVKRDLAIQKNYDVEFLSPFLDYVLVEFAMTIPQTMKLNNEHAKLILRHACLKMGLLEDFSFRKKRAAQYGARTDNALQKIAKKNGFIYRKDYIQAVLKKNS